MSFGLSSSPFVGSAVARAVLLALALVGHGCTGTDTGLRCEQAAECSRGGVQGECSENYCAFLDVSCESALRWDATANEERAGQCVTRDERRCGGSLEVPLTPMGDIAAETVYNSESRFQAIGAVDGNHQTSWFSSGPDADRTPTWFRWRVAAPQCIQNVSLIGNGHHSDFRFRQDFGFGGVTVQILQEGQLVFSRYQALTGTPDPDITVDVGGVQGTEVLLQFTGHEDDSCGGFSELSITGVR